MSFWRNVCKEQIWRLPESPNTQKNLPKIYQQELATLMVKLVAMEVPREIGERESNREGGGMASPNGMPKINILDFKF